MPASEFEAGDHKLKASPGYIVTLLSNKTKSWVYNLVVEDMPRMCDSVGSVPGMANRKMNKQLFETKQSKTKEINSQTTTLSSNLKSDHHQTLNDQSFSLHLQTFQQIFILSFTFLAFIQIQISFFFFEVQHFTLIIS